MPPRTKKASTKTPKITAYTTRSVSSQQKQSGQIPTPVKSMDKMADQDKQKSGSANNLSGTQSNTGVNTEHLSTDTVHSGEQTNQAIDNEVGATCSANSELKEMERKLLVAIGQLSTKIDSKSEEVKSELRKDIGDLKAQLTQLDSSVQANAKKLNDLETSVNYAHGEIEDVKTKATQIEKENKKLKDRVDIAEKGRKDAQQKLEQYQQSTKESLNDLERHARGFSIRVRGAPAIKQGENYRSAVASILIQEALVDSDDLEEVTQEIEHAHPLGPRRDDKITLIARLHNRPVRNSIVAKAKKKPFVEGGIRVVEDLTKLDYGRKRDAYPLMKEAYENGKRAVFRQGKLFIDGEETTIPRASKNKPN